MIRCESALQWSSRKECDNALSSGTDERVFENDERIRLGIWGLGRGLSFYKMCEALNMDVVAGCDYNEHMRQRFLECNSDAFATGDAEEFLARDFDAVLLATYCPAHADDAIACLNAGKHVLSEVTAFHTMAEGVRLVEAVEKSGLVYNMAENCPFTAPNMYLKRKWEEGLFGELMYAEYEYVHEVLTLSYTYIDGTPIDPGNKPHSWRSWINYHYYNTHSLGPMMYITGLRPTRVVSLPGRQRLPGYLMKGIDGMGGVAPSLISMSNGAVIRNLMGATTNDSHIHRIWGTLGSAEQVDGELRLRLGTGGGSPKLRVQPRWEKHTSLAEGTGHHGADFWVMYFFAREILEGVPAPFDIYTACDCTLPGILGYRSQVDGGIPHVVPDFRSRQDREEFRADDSRQPRYDVERGLFPPHAEPSIARSFSETVRDLVNSTRKYRAFRDWRGIAPDIQEPSQLLGIIDEAIDALPHLQSAQQRARLIIRSCPDSDGARVLAEILELSDEEITSRPEYAQELGRDRACLLRETNASGDAEGERSQSGTSSPS